MILMKIGKRLPDIIGLLEETNLIDGSTFVSHAGMPNQRPVEVIQSDPVAFVAPPKRVAQVEPNNPPQPQPASVEAASSAATPEDSKPVAVQSEGPSFDCTKASTPVEKAICAEPKLAMLDVSVAEAYKAVLATAPDKEAVKRQQSDWRRNVRDVCSTSTCIVQAYMTRMEQFK